MGYRSAKAKYLVPQAKGEKLATYGLTEPGAGSDVVGSRSTARREGDEYVLNGEKMWISLADMADNFLFFCWTDEEKRRKRDHSGMSCFIVERTMKGFSSGTIHGKLGIRAGNTGYFSLQDVRCRKRISSVKKVKGSRSRCLLSSRVVTLLQLEQLSHPRFARCFNRIRQHPRDVWH